MEEIYVNIEQCKPVDQKPSTNQTGARSSKRRFHGSVVLCLGLLCVFLLAGLIGLGVTSGTAVHSSSNRDSSAELSSIRTKLMERLQASNDKLSSVSEQSDLLNASLTEMTKELDRLQSLSTQKKTCPAGWRMFSCSCYFFSPKSDSWDKGREDCRNRGADMVIIDSPEEQEFLSELVKRDTWIGLTDRNIEASWKWIDGTPLTLRSWSTGQPDNGGGHSVYGEEDCAHIMPGVKRGENWNDIRCDKSMQWICERMA